MLTVFTPTYNRAELLSRVYQSLTEQTNREFVWLIVDDGSSDGTEEKVTEWIKENIIRIRYIYQRNGGKMRAHNAGVKACDTELFVCLDSDDYFTKEAVCVIVNTWKKSGGPQYAGIVAHKGADDSHTLSGEAFPDVSSSTLGALYRGGFHGETTLVFRTDVLRNYLFPEIPGEKYVPEDFVYDKIDEEYSLIVVHEILTICELMQEGYTDQAAMLRKANPKGWYLYYEQRAGKTKMSILKIKYISHYICFSVYLKKNIWKSCGTGRLSWWEIVAGLPGALLLWLNGKM